MAKRPNLGQITSSVFTVSQLNTAYDKIDTAFDNTLSRDGSTPNTMLADLDMNSNDILNVGVLDGDQINVNEAYIGGKLFTGTLTWRSDWLTATSYQELDLVKQNGNVYVALEEHTSGVFASDLSALRWELFVENATGPAGPQGPQGEQGPQGPQGPQGLEGSPASVEAINAAVVAAAWSRAGNGGTSSESDFIGTTDNVPMVFKSNNLRRLVIGANGNIGINLSTVSPGQLLHLGDGNILLEGGGETAMLFKLGTTLDGVTPLGATHPNAPFVNPIFQIGRVIEGGDGAPQFRWMYSDDNKGERVVFELDSEGILSSVRQAGVRGSHFEAHRSGDTHPLFRLNSSPHMQLQMGNGGTDDTDIAIGRTAAQKGALQYGPPTAQVTAAEWSSAGFKVAVGGLIFPDNSVQTTASTAPGAPGGAIEGNYMAFYPHHISNYDTYTLIGVGSLTMSGSRYTPEASVGTPLGRAQRVQVRFTGSSTTNCASVRSQYTELFTVNGPGAGIGGFKAHMLGAPSVGCTNSSHRFFMGMIEQKASLPDQNPSGMTNFVGIGYDSADSQLHIMHNDGSGSATKVALGASFPKPTSDNSVWYGLRLTAPAGTTRTIDWEVTELQTGAVASGTITTDLPATDKFVSPAAFNGVGGVSAPISLVLGNYVVYS